MMRVLGWLGFGAIVTLVSCSRRPSMEADAGAGGAAAAQSGRDRIASFQARSDISACLSVEARGGTASENLAVGTLHLETKKIIAECGCTSRWLLARTLRVASGFETEIASAVVLAPDPNATGRDVHVVLDPDRDHPQAGTNIVAVGCR